MSAHPELIGVFIAIGSVAFGSAMIGIAFLMHITHHK